MVDYSVLANLDENSVVDFHSNWAMELDSVDYCCNLNLKEHLVAVAVQGLDLMIGLDNHQVVDIVEEDSFVVQAESSFLVLAVDWPFVRSCLVQD